MKTSSFLLLAFLVICTSVLHAGDVRGTSPITEGLFFRLAFPNFVSEPNDTTAPWCIQVIIRAHYDGWVRVKDGGGATSVVIDKRLFVKADSAVTVNLPRVFIESVVGETERQSITVTSEVPVAVETVVRTNAIIETMQHLPVQSWGTEYLAAATYEDLTGGAFDSKYTQGELTIIAHEDNTVVKLTPTFPFRAGITTPQMPVGTVSTINMMAGEVIFLLGLQSTNFVRDYRSDISGTLIQSNKKIGVISGHQRAAVMRYPNTWSAGTTFTYTGAKIRNLLAEALLPTSMAGTSFVIAPTIAPKERVPNAARPAFGADDERGDVIQFIALQDSTIISARDSLGALTALAMIKARTSFRLEQFTSGQEIVCSKPALCFQYSKAYASSAVDGKGFDGASSMMQIVPSVDRWIDRCVLYTPDVDLEQFITLICRADEAGVLMVNDTSALQRWPSFQTPIAGTPYVTFRVPLPADTSHLYRFSLAAEGSKFFVWNYASKVSHTNVPGAYGVPVATDLSQPCSDQIIVEQSGNPQCGSYDIRATFKNGVACDLMYDMFLRKKDNMDLTVDIQNNKFYLYGAIRVVDLTMPASATLVVRANSGAWLERTFSYEPDRWQVDSLQMHFGLMNAAEERCLKLHITNPSADSMLRLRDIQISRPNSIFTVDRSSLTLAPGASADLTICCRMSAFTLIVDTVTATVNCHTMPLTVVMVEYQQPKIAALDVYFDSLLVDDSATRTLTIHNVGTTSFIWNGYDSLKLDGYRNQRGPFFWVTDLSGSDTLQPGDSASCTIHYSPRGQRKAHATELILRTTPRSIKNAVKLYGYGKTISTGVSAERPDVTSSIVLQGPVPQPVGIADDCRMFLTAPPGARVSVTLVDACGRTTDLGTAYGTGSPEVVSFNLSTFHALPGAYRIIASDGLSCSLVTILTIP